MKRICGTCAAFEVSPDRTKGFCHFGPPTVLLAGVQPPRFTGGPATPVTISAWPTIEPEAWCKMWMPTDEAPAEAETELTLEQIDQLMPPIPPYIGATTFGTVGKPEPRHAGSDTFRAGPPTPRAVDYTSTHKPSKDFPDGGWRCCRCGTPETDFASKDCRTTQLTLPDPEPLASAESEQQ